jgi:tRNA-modifying protein YgfZ
MLGVVAGTATETLREDYRVLVEGCGLLDRSERGKLALTGPDAVEFLNGQITNELADLAPGEGRYAAFLTHKGKMLGDLRVLAVAGDGGEMELLLDTERVALQNLFDMIRRFKVGYRVELHKRTLERGLLSLIGPGAERVVASAGLGIEEHANVGVEIAGVPALAIRTDLGVDLLCEAERTEDLIRSLQDRGAVTVREDAAECLRVERGRPRFGIDLDETVIPQEAGLNERAVSFTKGCYVGQETVARLFYKGKPNRHLRAVKLSEPLAPGAELFLNSRAVGRLGSVAISPDHGVIGLAILRREAEPGATLTLADSTETVLVTP